MPKLSGFLRELFPSAREHRDWIIRPILQLLERIIMTQDELAQSLVDLGTQVDKIGGEIKTEVANLEAQITSNGTVPDNVAAALTSLKAKLQTLDDLNPDAPAATDSNGDAAAPAAS